jgi:hypothetical protein
MLFTELSILATPFLLGKTIDGLMSGTYVNNFLISLLSAPVAIEMYTRLADVLKRIN